jgi:hypothetical protein
MGSLSTPAAVRCHLADWRMASCMRSVRGHLCQVFSWSHHAVIRVYDSGNVIEKHEQGVEFNQPCFYSHRSHLPLKRISINFVLPDAITPQNIKEEFIHILIGFRTLVRMPDQLLQRNLPMKKGKDLSRYISGTYFPFGLDWANGVRPANPAVDRGHFAKAPIQDTMGNDSGRRRCDFHSWRISSRI